MGSSNTMMDFTRKGNQSNLLYTSYSSIKSSSNITNNSSTITTSSSIASGASSIISTDSIIPADPYNLSFITENHKYYQKLLDDLSIIDNIYDIFTNGYDQSASELSTSLYEDKQVVDIARHIASKQQTLDSLLLSETTYVNDLYTFHDVFVIRIETWLNETTDKDAISKFKASPSRADLNLLFQTIHDLATTHTTFLKDLKERIALWGPTQLISDILNKLYDSLKIYEPFMHHHPEFVMVLDNLYKLPTFAKFIDATLEDSNKNRHPALQAHDLIHYIHEPLYRLTAYTKALKQLSHYSDPAHPDYTSLLHVSQKFKSLEKEWTAKVQDCQSHLMVLEAYRAIQECPINITIYRRLLLFAHLIKVDLDDITLTSDVRMYFLYNDSLIYCRRQKENKKKNEAEKSKLVYKGTLQLRGADVRLLAPSFLAKMVEVKKPLFRIGKKSSSASDSNSLPGAEAFGFELVTTEVNIDAMSPMHANYQSATMSGGSSIKRRHILRTRSQAENSIWFETLRKAARTANSLPR